MIRRHLYAMRTHLGPIPIDKLQPYKRLLTNTDQLNPLRVKDSERLYQKH